MSISSRIRRGLLAACGLAVCLAWPLAAQGVGATGLQVAQMPAGARAAALSGAYSAVGQDADVVFYNPAGIAGLFRAASLSYQRHVMDVSLGSIAGAALVGPVVVGAGIAYLDGGRIPVIEPDPDFGGERGRETGATAAARETASRLAVGMPLLDNQLFVGAAVGFATSELAGVSRSAPLFDLGVQGALPHGITLGAALRNAGGAMSGRGAEDAQLPIEARLGGAVAGLVPQREFGGMFTLDGIYRWREEIFALAAGVEAGLIPDDPERVGGVLRIGYQVDPDLTGMSPLQLGAGITYQNISVDYFFQSSTHLGAAHRIGVRWRQGPP